MQTRPSPGLAFTLASDAGLIVGLVTHDRPPVGSLVWVAQPTFDGPPTLTEAQAIDRWRWPVFFPVATALRRRIVDSVGTVEVPAALTRFPVLRSGSRAAGWQAFTEDDAGTRLQLGPAADASVPVYQVVNDTRLREMIVSGWRPEKVW